MALEKTRNDSALPPLLFKIDPLPSLLAGCGLPLLARTGWQMRRQNSLSVRAPSGLPWEAAILSTLLLQSGARHQQIIELSMADATPQLFTIPTPLTTKLGLGSR